MTSDQTATCTSFPPSRTPIIPHHRVAWMEPGWRVRLHSPLPPTPLPRYLQTTVDAALTAITPSLLAGAPPSSVLLLGPPASGKSLVSKHILHHLDTAAGGVSDSNNLTHLTLSGLLHATPLRAWRHVASTLSSDTFSTATVQQCLAAIATIFARFRAARTPLVIVLDHFDRFVTTTDGMSQTVLYSLLNFLQDRHIRVACIAMTASIDVTDALEKRVKSRFVHRQLVVPLPDDPTDVLNWVSDALLHHPSNRTKSKSKSNSPSVNVVRTFLNHPRCVDAVRKSLLRTRVVAPILQALDPAFVAAFHDVRKNTLTARVDTACDIFENILKTRDPTVETLSTLTELEIALLVALRKLVARADKRDERVTITFADVFRHYESATVEEGFSTTKDADRVVERGVAEKSWERLVECGAVVRLGHGPREMRACLLGVAGENVDRALQDHAVASSVWKKWGKKR